MFRVNKVRNKVEAITGLAAVGGSAAGVASATAAVITYACGEFLIARLCLMAAGFAFGLLANAILLGARFSRAGSHGG